MITFPVFCNLCHFSLDLGLYQIFSFFPFIEHLPWEPLSQEVINTSIQKKKRGSCNPNYLTNQIGSWWNETGGWELRDPLPREGILMMVPTRGGRCTHTAPGLPNKLIAVSNTNYRFQPLLRFQALGLICKSFIQPKFDSFCFPSASSQI